jgi:RNA polymerase sigma-70 factor (ECF subfamily)
MHSVAELVISRPDEAEWAHRASKGDADAFGCLYKLYFDRIYRYVYYRTGRVTEAEDLTERVFLKAWEAMGRYQQRGSGFSPWLYRIARNAIIDHRRTKKDTLSLEDLPLPTAAEGLTPEEALVEREEARNLQAAIARLPEEQQEVVILRFIEGISHAEVATVIGKSEGTSRVVQYRALAALHEIMSEER